MFFFSLIIFLLVIVGGVIVTVINSPQYIGASGEKFVGSKLNGLDSNCYKILDNILLSCNNEIKTTQIDHIVVSIFGIFCIETKAYKGWILGRAIDKYWTQIIYQRRTRFYNPLRQNYGHVKAIESLITPLQKSVPIYSFVAFPSADKLKITGTDSVGYARDVINKIESYKQQVISEEERDKICEIIFKANISDDDIRKEHIRKVKDMQDNLGVDLHPRIKRRKYKRRYYRNYDDNYYDDDDYYNDDD